MRLPLIKGSRVDTSAEWRDSLPKNMTAFVQQVGDNPGYVRTADGLKLFTNGFGEDRGGIWSDRFVRHVRVSGDRLIEVDQFGAVTDVGSPTTIAGSSQAIFDNSFNSIAFVVNGDYYRYVPGSGLTNLGDSPDALPFQDICFIDGYYILNDKENLWATDIADETTINPINFAGSDFAPDNIVGVDKTTDNKLIVFNRYTTERFVNNAGPQFPFARLPNAAIPIGIVGPKAKASIGDGRFVVFGGGKEYSPTFYLLTNSYQNISTKEIDSIIDTYNDFELQNMVIEYRDVRDQGLVICHLPRHTLVYDATYSAAVGQPIWYEWTSGDSPYRGINGVYDPRSVDDSASAWIYGDKDDNRIGKLDVTVCTQYGEPLEWEVNTPIARIGGTVAEMEVQTTPGHTFEENPVVFLSTTKDAVLYGSEVMLASGKTGQYQHRIIARRLGDYPNWFGLKLRGYSRTITSLAGCEIR